jgi:hypothetical protein
MPRPIRFAQDDVAQAVFITLFNALYPNGPEREGPGFAANLKLFIVNLVGAG